MQIAKIQRPSLVKTNNIYEAKKKKTLILVSHCIQIAVLKSHHYQCSHTRRKRVLLVCMHLPRNERDKKKERNKPFLYNHVKLLV